MAKTIAPYVDAKAELRVTSMEVTGDESEGMGCNIAIAHIVE